MRQWNQRAGIVADLRLGLQAAASAHADLACMPRKIAVPVLRPGVRVRSSLRTQASWPVSASSNTPNRAPEAFSNKARNVGLHCFSHRVCITRIRGFPSQLRWGQQEGGLLAVLILWQTSSQG